MPSQHSLVTEKDEQGFYKLETQHGILKGKYTKSEFDPCKERFLSQEDVPKGRVPKKCQSMVFFQTSSWEGYSQNQTLILIFLSLIKPKHLSLNTLIGEQIID